MDGTQEKFEFESLEVDPEPPPDPRQGNEPLASRVRPRTLAEFIGQRRFVSKVGPLSSALSSGRLQGSWILWGPPGCGKTTLAHLMAQQTCATFHILSAVQAGLKDLRELLQLHQSPGTQHILFLDEIHRFNKVQQDALLPLLENGRLTLLGATTENPYLELRKALLSRCRIIKLDKLRPEEIVQILAQAIKDPRGLGSWKLAVGPEVLQTISQRVNGDARSALNLLELCVARGRYSGDGLLTVDLECLESLFDEQALAFGRDSDRRYDLISALIKSIRGSDPDAAIYWLACLVSGGEDPAYLFRRLLISASEDVGLADPSAVTVVLSCAQAFDRVGLPEGRYHLSQATLYLATANKSPSTGALHRAETFLRSRAPVEVPLDLRDGTYSGAAEHGIGVGYINPHRTGERRRTLPKELQDCQFYEPTNSGYEKVITQRLEHYRARGEK